MNAEALFVNAAGFSSLFAFWIFAIASAFQARLRVVGAAGVHLLVFCFVCISISLLVRALGADRFPIANLYESLLFFSWGLLLAFVVLRNRISTLYLGCLTALCVSLVFLYASWLPPGLHEIRPLMPALVSFWRVIHVPPLIVSYAFFLISGLVAILNLWSARRRMTAICCLMALTLCVVCVFLGTLKLASAQVINLLFWFGLSVSLVAMFLLFYMETKIAPVTTEFCGMTDAICQKSISIAFPLLTFGIITGAFWANHAWGAYWTWDPKESMSLATWLSYAAYLHLRARDDCRTDSLSLCAFLGLLLTILTYLGFTFMGLGGLHTYGNLA
ncbi:MAG: c-type cytochrome biogenesis protein CcsB [Candidatus Obscuribacterales bacterium]|nr:c-type cytochrome biogenesis protein CcsB [Candidatus Obscuribacterales bacterium]